MKTRSEQSCFGGTQGFYEHRSQETGTDMQFAVYTPPSAKNEPVPVVYYLAGLTCTDETATIKAGAQRVAAQLGLMLVMPDTSPRGAMIDGEDESWDFGTGAGFYLDATQAPWSKNYRMYSYITKELPSLIAAHFPSDNGPAGIMGHSMGGHGALTIGLKNTEQYASITAFAPICAPSQCPWGQKAFNGYLGDNKAEWDEYDAVALVNNIQTAHPILIDQGKADPFLEQELNPHLFEQACKAADQPLIYRSHSGYDHSYYFIQSFMEDHLLHHSKILKAL
ncbi:S-formylglutathione hydrolase [Sneathiella aquimaris]|uniref:S-formylglutathione hydrolase n=1 Tax=Sneathiella aquimaris TaxID=2599305 RepID=UPI00146EFA66|nr:S-formylglutathione hydrolase [Sneathiella aquimaris]